MQLPSTVNVLLTLNYKTSSYMTHVSSHFAVSHFAVSHFAVSYFQGLGFGLGLGLGLGSWLGLHCRLAKWETAKWETVKWEKAKWETAKWRVTMTQSKYVSFTVFVYKRRSNTTADLCGVNVLFVVHHFFCIFMLTKVPMAVT